MKQMKIALVAILAIVMGTTFTSCLNSDSGSSWDSGTFVTIKSNYLGTAPTLLTDDGYTLVPTNPSVLPKYKDGSYGERCFVYFLWGEGVVFDGDRSKRYEITIHTASDGLIVRGFCNDKDTIEHDYPISEVTQCWGANGEYLTAEWRFNYTNETEKVGFELYPEEVENNVLIMRLRQSLGSEGGYKTSPYLISFTMPTLSDISDILGTQLEAPNDSISMKIAYRKNSSEGLSTTNTFKVKINN